MGKITSGQRQILNYLGSHPSESFYLRKLARALQKDPGNLARSIQPLVENNLLARKKMGNQVYFSKKEIAELPSLPEKILNEDTLKEGLRQIEPDLIKLTRELIRIPSVSGENPEREIAEYLINFAKSKGLKVSEATKDTFRPNLILDSDPGKKENFLLLGHMDTIGIGPMTEWNYSPFSGHLEQGKIIGRGAMDMKAGIACALFTLVLIKQLNLDLPYNVRVVLVSNEEGGSTDTPIFDQGMKFLVENNFVQGRAAIYGYGGSYKIGIGHRGVLRIRIKTQGESIHTGSVKWQRKERGVNAVTAAAEILLALEKMNLPKTKHPAFPRHGNVITPGTMILHGGSAVSTVPGECTGVVEVRYLPGLDIRGVYSQIKDICERIAQKRKGIRVHLEKFVEIPAVVLPEKEPVVEALKGACLSVYGKEISVRGTGPANESFLLIQKGIPTVVFGPLGEGAHAPNEFVYLESLPKTVRVYLKTLENLAAL